MTTRKPWWQASRTSHQGFVFGSGWLVLGLIDLAIGLFGGGHVWQAVIGYLC